MREMRTVRRARANEHTCARSTLTRAQLLSLWSLARCEYLHTSTHQLTAHATQAARVTAAHRPMHGAVHKPGGSNRSGARHRCCGWPLANDHLCAARCPAHACAGLPCTRMCGASLCTPSCVIDAVRHPRVCRSLAILPETILVAVAAAAEHSIIHKLERTPSREDRHSPGQPWEPAEGSA